MTTPRWREAFDAAERQVTPRLEQFVRTPTFSVGAALLRRARSTAESSFRDLTAHAWHLVNLPAGSDVSRLRAQVGALDREVRRLTVQLEAERRRSAGPPSRPATGPEREEQHADGAHPAGGARPRPARRRTQRPAGA
jgi:hypothetical protein